METNNEHSHKAFSINGTEVDYNILHHFNREDEEFIELLRSMEVDQQEDIGGGAAPIILIKRVR